MGLLADEKLKVTYEYAITANLTRIKITAMPIHNIPFVTGLIEFEAASKPLHAIRLRVGSKRNTIGYRLMQNLYNFAKSQVLSRRGKSVSWKITAISPEPDKQ